MNGRMVMDQTFIHNVVCALKLLVQLAKPDYLVSLTERHKLGYDDHRHIYFKSLHLSQEFSTAEDVSLAAGLIWTGVVIRQGHVKKNKVGRRLKDVSHPTLQGSCLLYTS